MKRLRSAAVVVLAMVTLAVAAAPARAANIGEKCNDDRECAVGSICSNKSICTALPKKDRKSVV